MTNPHIQTLNVERFLRNALEASVYVDPANHGLSRAELIEIGSRYGFEIGEIDDALSRGSSHMFDLHTGPRVMPLRSVTMYVTDFRSKWDDDPRNIEAFQWVRDHLHELARKEGRARAGVDRDVLIARGEAQGFSRHDVELAVLAYELCGAFKGREDGTLGLGSSYASPDQQTRNEQHSRPNAPTAGLIQTVADVMARRTDGRPKHAEALKAFGELLAKKTNAQYRLWWDQTCAELRRADPSHMPTSALVLAAALAEGALALVAVDVRRTGESMTGGVFDQDPKEWRFVVLAKEARRGRRPVFTDPALTDRCDQLNTNRQRIHAGRFLSLSVPTPKIDIRPEEARQARETLEQVVRSILDWFAD